MLAARAQCCGIVIFNLLGRRLANYLIRERKAEKKADRLGTLWCPERLNESSREFQPSMIKQITFCASRSPKEVSDIEAKSDLFPFLCLSVCLSVSLSVSVSLCLCPSLSLCQFYPLLSLSSRDCFYKSITLFRILVQRIIWLTHIDINNKNKTTLIHAAPSFGYLYVILHTHGLNRVDGNVYWLIKKKNKTTDFSWTAKTF